jgi:hypothetical protein
MALYKIESISQFKHTYFIEAQTKEHAEDEFVMRDSGAEEDYFDEAKQEHLGEQIFGTQEITKEDFEHWIAKERAERSLMSSHWMGDKLIRKVSYTEPTVEEPEIGAKVFRALGSGLIIGRPDVDGLGWWYEGK